MKIASVEQIVNRYITDHVDHVAIDHKRASIAWKRLALHFGNIPINKLSGKHVSDYTKKRDASAGTINRELGVLSAALRKDTRMCFFLLLLLCSQGSAKKQSSLFNGLR